MKLIVQIPCFNEERTLAAVIRDIPRTIEGIDDVEVLVLDDGSTDRTSEVARREGADHLIRLKRNAGLASAFAIALDYALSQGADIVVNTDGDGQYRGRDIPRLVRPILRGTAEMVVGVRNFDQIPSYPRLKHFFQNAGSLLIRILSGTRIPDATSGFRAYSREAAMQLHITSSYTYTFDTIIQMGKKRLPVHYVPIRVNPPKRASRLYRTPGGYVLRTGASILRIYTLYEPLKTFSFLGLLSFAAGFVIGCRFLYFYITVNYSGHVQSLILSAILILAGVSLFFLGLLGDLIAINRRRLEDLNTRCRRIDYALSRRDVSRSGHGSDSGEDRRVDAIENAPSPEDTARAGEHTAQE
jgi:glycosyltransferase involved in cell wall biosynthesis